MEFAMSLQNLENQPPPALPSMEPHLTGMDPPSHGPGPHPYSELTEVTSPVYSRSRSRHTRSHRQPG